MKYKAKAVKGASYVSAIAIIACASVAAMLLIMAAIGLIFPRKAEITLVTDSITKIYDGTETEETDITIKYGKLHPNHQLEIISRQSYTNVGEYVNAPKYKITDSTGSDVTDMYAVIEDFGLITVNGREITIYSPSKVKAYDATPLESNEIVLVGGSLCEGHEFVPGSKTSITLPGQTDIIPSFLILDKDGEDVTEQYYAVNQLGTLTVEKRAISVLTRGSNKVYDGTPLSNTKWELLHGKPLDGHKLNVKCITSVTEVGSHDNLADVWVEDEYGEDVSQFYDVTFTYGKLEIKPMVLHIETGSASQQYNGESLQCTDWKITSGSVSDGESIKAVSYTKVTAAGTHKNEIVFQITDAKGIDITNRYSIAVDCGTLNITPRALTIRTKSASKVYDGKPLNAKGYEIIKGTLCAGDTLEIATTSIVNVGYTQNYVVDYSIYKENENGTWADVSTNYRLTYDYGVLTVTN